MTVRFSTREYERSHGRRPAGRGSWAFCPADKWNADDYLDHCVWVNNVTLTEAKKVAREKFLAAGVTDVVVCS